MAIRKITLLHSNDMHGDFLPKTEDGFETGGLVRLSGYVNKIRKEEEHVVYAMAGDMFRGSIIDSEYMGLSTIDLVNILNPDVAAVGNHEVDYGLAHLLFLEKCAQFPIINANMFITINNARLFEPFLNIRAGGVNILFIGILTKEVLDSTKTEKVVGTFIDVEEAAREVGIICDNYRTSDTDLTVLLTHIGIEEDRKLAEYIDKRWGVDLIIGGHTHTEMNEPEVINGIPIVQAGSGTGHIGRFDIEYDTWRNKIRNYTWQYVPINEETAPKDEIMETMLEMYRTETDTKYRRVVTRLARKLTHPARNQETELGNLYADIMQDESSFDLMLFGSGSIRKQEFGPIVEYQDMLENTPFDDDVHMVEVTGEQFRRIVLHLLRDEAWEGHTEFYQMSRGVRIKYRRSTRTLEEFRFNGKDITDDMHLRIALQHYHFMSFDEFMGVPLAEVVQNMRPRIVMSSQNNVIEEYFSTHPALDAHVEGRIEIVE